MSLLSPHDRPMLVAVLDRLIPAVDSLPAAGVMGVLDDIERMVTPADRFGAALLRFAAALSSDYGSAFATLPPEAQESAVGTLENRIAPDFALVLEITYLAYYARPEVSARIGWRTGPLQPLGFELPPFDESVLDVTRRRAPFWRQT